MMTDVNTGAPALPKMGVLELIVLTIITLGVYQAVWFLKRLEAINALNSPFKFSQGPFGFVIAGCVAHVSMAVYVVAVGAGIDKSLLETFTAVSDMLVMAIQIIMLFQCFKLRRAIIDHLGDAAGNARFSWLWTLLFGLFYVQYKINRIELESGGAA